MIGNLRSQMSCLGLEFLHSERDGSKIDRSSCCWPRLGTTLRWLESRPQASHWPPNKISCWILHVCFCIGLVRFEILWISMHDAMLPRQPLGWNPSPWGIPDLFRLLESLDLAYWPGIQLAVSFWSFCFKGLISGQLPHGKMLENDCKIL